MKNEYPTIVRAYYKVMVEEEFAHDLWEHEWDGVEYEDYDEAKAEARKAEERSKVANAWVESFCIDTEGNLWEFDKEWRDKIAEGNTIATEDYYIHCDFGLVEE